MSIEREFLALMPSTVTVFEKQSRDAYGKPSFANAGTHLRCRITRSDKKVINADGDEVVEEGRIYVYGTSTITTDDRLILPDSTVAIVLSIATLNDETGPHHTVIGFGRA